MEDAMKNVIEFIEDFFGDFTTNKLTESGVVNRLNASDVGLDIRAGTVYLDTEYEAIIVVGETRNIEYYGGFEYIEKSTPSAIMRIQMGSEKVTVYLAEESDRVQRCLDHYYNVYLPDREAQEENAKKNTH